jgi:diaminopimelate epimerase
MSVGADGLILIEPSDQADFKWQFFNADGSPAEMCGNGARCAARVARMLGVGGQYLCFETQAGVVKAEINQETVKIQMTDPGRVDLDERIDTSLGTLTYSRVNTGVPHVVIEVPDIENAPVQEQGREVRFHSLFAPAGTNVNFISPAEAGIWSIRTYERGVEDETLACGTGNVAAALVLAKSKGVASPVTFRVRSNSLLKIYFQQNGNRYNEIFLEGDARLIYTAALYPDAWQYQ